MFVAEYKGKRKISTSLTYKFGSASQFLISRYTFAG